MALDVQGYKRATMTGTKSSNTAMWSKSQKTGLSSDWSLQLDSMKLESLVIANQQCRGEYVPGSCTHRPSSQPSWLYPKLVSESFRIAAGEGMVSKGD